MRPITAIAWIFGAAAVASAQQQAGQGTVRVAVVQDSAPVAGALVRARGIVLQTDASGRVVLTLPPGRHVVTVSRMGLRSDSAVAFVRAGEDTTVTLDLVSSATLVDQVIVSAVRSERRFEDVPLRVEVLAREEVEEKMLMTPGDISMMLNETGGLRVQTTSPSLGAANVRVQGLRGRYTLMLSDGLPLMGGQTGALGLLQIPPMDLERVEVIKGVASALYGSAALGGVVNLVSRRPSDEPDHEVLVNQTSRAGSDAIVWSSRTLSERWGYTFLGGTHRQERQDVDGDGWADMPGYRRLVARPRAFWSGRGGRNAFLTIGTTIEDRDGGTVPGFLAPDSVAFPEALETRRLDAGAVVRIPFRSSVFSARTSATTQAHLHTFGLTQEDDRHDTWFGEAALATGRGFSTWVLGVAAQAERYRSPAVSRFNTGYAIPAAFAQLDVEPRSWLAMSTSARVDVHSEFGAAFNPRVSVLLRGPAAWTVRLSVGTGVYAPTPFTEETEATGLTPLRALGDLAVERARSASVDVGGQLGSFELNATVFASAIESPLLVGQPAGGPAELEMINASLPTETVGADALVRYRLADLTTTLAYTLVRATEQSDVGLVRRDVALTPRHAAGLVSVWESEDRFRVGIEVYYTGAQALDDNPYLAEGKPYLIVGAIGERTIGRGRVFINLENLGGARMTRHQPLVRPARGDGGRWTTDAWGPVEGRTINAGVRLRLGAPAVDE